MTSYYVFHRGKMYPCSSLESAVFIRDYLTGNIKLSNEIKDGIRATSPTAYRKTVIDEARAELERMTDSARNQRKSRKTGASTATRQHKPTGRKKKPGQCLYSNCQNEATMTFGVGLNFCKQHTRGAETVLKRPPTNK